MQSWESGRVDQLSGITRSPRGLMVSAKSHCRTDSYSSAPNAMLRVMVAANT
jgi:hypothetical protein